MDSQTVTAIGAAIATTLGAWALVVNARAKGAKPLQALRGLWGWIQYAKLEPEVPPILADDVRDLLKEEAEK